MGSGEGDVQPLKEVGANGCYGWNQAPEPVLSQAPVEKGVPRREWSSRMNAGQRSETEECSMNRTIDRLLVNLAK